MGFKSFEAVQSTLASIELRHMLRKGQLEGDECERHQYLRRNPQRYHERRATGRKGTSPTLVLRGTVWMAVCAATRLHPCTGEDLVPASLQAWQALRQKLESRRQQRVHRSRHGLGEVSKH